MFSLRPCVLRVSQALRIWVLDRSVSLALWLYHPRQYWSECPLARDDRIPPLLCPRTGYGNPGGEVEELVLAE